MEFLSHTLDNGLEIVAECNEEAHSTGLGFFVRTGARDESDELAGVSHFLEHMVFKGTPRRSAEDVNREFDEMGAHHNAFTSEEHTVYYAAVLPECQTPCIELLADIMRPSLRDDDFNMEKKVIIEEIRMYDDQPPYGGEDKLKTMHFGRHPLAKSVLGTVESITALPVEQMRGYFNERYSPSNIVLAAAGKVDFDALIEQAQRICGSWETVTTNRDASRAPANTGFGVVHRENSVQQYVLQMCAGPAAADSDRFAARLLATVLGDDSGSRLYWKLVDSGLAEHVSLDHYEFDGSGIYMTHMSCDPSRAPENLQILHDAYREVEAEGFREDELAQAKSKLRSRVVLSSERPRSRLFFVGGNWLQRHEYRSVKDDLDELRSITLDDLHTVLAKYPLTKSTTLAIGPRKKLKPPK